MIDSPLASLLTTLVVGIGLLVWSLSAEHEPLLGLDLQGGAAVVLQPTEEADSGRHSRGFHPDVLPGVHRDDIGDRQP